METLIVVAQTVPSEVQSTAGSDWKLSPDLARHHRLLPTGAAVAGVEHRQRAAAMEIVGAADDQARIPVVHPDVRLRPRAGLIARDPEVGPGSGDGTARLLLLQRPLPGIPRLQVRVVPHPLVDLLEHQGVAARAIARVVLQVRVVFPPEDTQPERHGDLVARLLGPQKLEVLVAGDQLLQRAPRGDPILFQLTLEGRPGGPGGARGGPGREEAGGHQRAGGQEEALVHEWNLLGRGVGVARIRANPHRPFEVCQSEVVHCTASFILRDRRPS